MRRAAERLPEDERIIRTAVRLARRRNPELDPSLFAFIESLLLLDGDGTELEREEQAAFALRFQQLTGPVMAKAVEDTAFYRYHRLVCLNQVGGAPAKFGTAIGEFHAQNEERLQSFPLAMTTSTTHDTKRGEDTSARIAVLSENARSCGQRPCSAGRSSPRPPAPRWTAPALLLEGSSTSSTSP